MARVMTSGKVKTQRDWIIRSQVLKEEIPMDAVQRLNGSGSGRKETGVPVRDFLPGLKI